VDYGVSEKTRDRIESLSVSLGKKHGIDTHEFRLTLKAERDSLERILANYGNIPDELWNEYMNDEADEEPRKSGAQ